MSKILVTGANGFVGKHLCEMLTAIGYEVTGAVRSNQISPRPANYEQHVVGDICGEVDWGPSLHNVDIVVHLAARVHIMNDRDADPLAAFRRVNVYGTEQLLRHDLMQNVSRFVYISTVKVHGEKSGKEPLQASDAIAPTDPYARSKFEAEQLVEEIAAEVGFETAIIRPPLVYGPGVGGNFVRLMRMVDKGYPLPFARVRNSRSLVSVGNLCDLIRECVTNSSAAGERFLVSDNSDISTPDLVRLMAAALKRQTRLFPIPVLVLKTAAMMVGRSAVASRLTESMQVNIQHTMNSLNWAPPVQMSEGIGETVSWYQEQ